MYQICLMKKMFEILTDAQWNEVRNLWKKECEKTKLGMLWEILFETDSRDSDLLEERIYAFGSKVTQNDYVYREIFVCLVAFLNLVIKEKTC